MEGYLFLSCDSFENASPEDAVALLKKGMTDVQLADAFAAVSMRTKEIMFMTNDDDYWCLQILDAWEKVEDKLISAISSRLTEMGIEPPDRKGTHYMVKPFMETEMVTAGGSRKIKMILVWSRIHAETFFGVFDEWVLIILKPTGHWTLDAFRRVQDEILRRKNKPCRGMTIFSGRIFCAECGASFGPKVWHSNDQYRRVIWQCNNKYKATKVCRMPHLYEDGLQAEFLKLCNKVASNREREIADLQVLLAVIGGTEELETKKTGLEAERDALAAQLQDLIEQNAKVAQNQETYILQYDDLASKYKAANEQVKELEQAILEKKCGLGRSPTSLRYWRPCRPRSRCSSLSFGHRWWTRLRSTGKTTSVSP